MSKMFGRAARSVETPTPPPTVNNATNNVLSQMKEAALKNIQSSSDPSVVVRNQRIYDELLAGGQNETTDKLAALAAYAVKFFNGKMIAANEPQEGVFTHKFIAHGCEIEIIVRKVDG